MLILSSANSVQVWPPAAASSPWAFGWDALAAVATAVAVLITLGVIVVDVVQRRRTAAMKRRILASGLLHAIQLSRNHLKAVAETLAGFHAKDQATIVQFGTAIINPHSGPITRSLSELSIFDEVPACDIAYAMALSDSIDTYGRWLSTFQGVPNEDQWDRMVEHAEFFAESANQAVEGLKNFEAVAKKHTPAHIMERRFGTGEVERGID